MSENKPKLYILRGEVELEVAYFSASGSPPSQQEANKILRMAWNDYDCDVGPDNVDIREGLCPMDWHLNDLVYGVDDDMTLREAQEKVKGGGA